MSAGKFDLEIEQGATYRRVFKMQDANKNPIDLTGYTADMQIRMTAKAPSALATLSTVTGEIVIGGTDGTIQLVIPAKMTSGFNFAAAVYDLRLTAPDGLERDRLLEGAVTVDPAVTR